jgi:drug/metabolite transporter (DMT)-like permease
MKSALLKLHIAVFLWGFTGVLGRLITLNEAWLVWYRLLFTLLVLGIWFAYSKSLAKFKWPTLLQLFALGSILALHWVFFYASIKYSNVSIALVCLSSAGLFTALLEPLFTKKPFYASEILLSLLAIVGIYLIFHFNTQYKLGIVLGLICTLLVVVFSIYNKKLMMQLPSTNVMFYELLGGFLLLTCLLPLYNMYFPPNYILPTIGDAIWLLVLSIFCTLLAMNLSLQALQKVSAFTQNLTVNLEPVYGISLAFLLYQENKELSNTFYWGFGIIACSVVVQMFRVLKLKKH